ncbi:MAG: decaprenyl-phosphate phosphoribosyltransferase [Gemmataceae bacterium]|nr:decaprenyl-phosphate phosphoribosyltransferase [Gemmataceae bacterium]
MSQIVSAEPIASAPGNVRATIVTMSPDQGTKPNRKSLLADLAALARPKQWTKNVFVIGPLLFSESLGQPGAVLAALTAFACFCLFSSAVYCINDVIDTPADRQHPRKRSRPIAAGRVSPAMAFGLAVLLVACGTLLAWTTLPPVFLLLAALYVANSLIYCLFLKHRVIADVISIAMGFVLRLQAGCAAIEVEPTSWILVCGFSLAMILGIGKRRLELTALAPGSAYRPALRSYSVDKLNLMLGVTSSVCLLSYMLYTVAPETIRLHSTTHLVYTVPFVAYGIFRYVFKVQEGGHDGPVDVLLHDPIFALNGLCWTIAVGLILYLKL